MPSGRKALNEVNVTLAKCDVEDFSAYLERYQSDSYKMIIRDRHYFLTEPKG
jgi:hypothetical protein